MKSYFTLIVFIIFAFSQSNAEISESQKEKLVNCLGLYAAHSFLTQDKLSLANIEMAVNNRTIWGNRLSKRGHFFRFCAQIVLLYCLRSLTSSTSPEVRDKYIAYNAIITLCVAIVGHSVGPTDAVATKAM